MYLLNTYVVIKNSHDNKKYDIFNVKYYALSSFRRERDLSIFQLQSWGKKNLSIEKMHLKLIGKVVKENFYCQ